MPMPAPTPSPAAESPFLGDEAGGAGGGEVAALSSPNMFGDRIWRRFDVPAVHSRQHPALQHHPRRQVPDFPGHRNPLTSASATFQGSQSGARQFQPAAGQEVRLQ